MQFEILIKRISPKLKGIAYKLNGRFTFMNHDDLYQEALLGLWLDFQKGKLSDKNDSYILQGCYFRLKNYIRTVNDKANLVSLDALIETEKQGWEEKLPVDNPQKYFDCLENKLLVERIKNQIPERQKQVLELCLEGLTIREIGQRMGVSHVAVVKLKNRIKEILEKIQYKSA